MITTLMLRTVQIGLLGGAVAFGSTTTIDMNDDAHPFSF
jgi:hypothetical protein